MKGRPPPTSMEFTSEQLAPEQEQGQHWHMWLRGEHCGRAPDDEGRMRMGGGGEGERRTLRVGGRRAACARHACASFWLLGMSFVIHLSLYREKRWREIIGEGVPPPLPQIQNNFDSEFRNPSRLSCTVKASTGWVALVQKPNFSSLPSPRLKHLSAV